MRQSPLAEEALIVAHEHHGFKLRRSFKRNADHNEQARGAERGRKAECAEHHRRDDRDHHQEERAEKRKAVADLAQILACGLAGTDARRSAEGSC